VRERWREEVRGGGKEEFLEHTRGARGEGRGGGVTEGRGGREG